MGRIGSFFLAVSVTFIMYSKFTDEQENSSAAIIFVVVLAVGLALTLGTHFKRRRAEFPEYLRFEWNADEIATDEEAAVRRALVDKYPEVLRGINFTIGVSKRG